MAKIKLKQTSMGSYGLAGAGDVVEVGEKVAEQLVSRGQAEYESASTPETKEGADTASENKEEVGEKVADTSSEKEKSSIKITDNTNKEKKTILKP